MDWGNHGKELSLCRRSLREGPGMTGKEGAEGKVALPVQEKIWMVGRWSRDISQNSTSTPAQNLDA